MATGPIIICAATWPEVAPLVRRLRLSGRYPRFTGACGGRTLMAAVSGIGAARMTGQLQALLAECRPEQVVLLGFAGGLDPSVQTGQVLAIRYVVDEHGAAFDVSAGVPAVRGRQAGDDPGSTLLSATTVVESVAQKRQLFAAHRAAAVDMESFHIAQLACERHVRLTVVRTIFDPAGRPLPRASLAWVKPDGRPCPRAVLAYLLRHPHHLPLVLRLARHSHCAANALARWLAPRLKSGVPLLPNATPSAPFPIN